MIRVKLLTGEYAGRERVIPPEVDPMGFLSSCLNHGDKWSVDYSQAMPEEILAWMKADIVCRINRALLDGRPVIFLGRSFVAKEGISNEERIQMAQDIEDMIVNSGRMITIGRDNDFIFEILALGYEDS